MVEKGKNKFKDFSLTSETLLIIFLNDDVQIDKRKDMILVAKLAQIKLEDVMHLMPEPTLQEQHT